MPTTNNKQPLKSNYGIAYRGGMELVSGIFVGVLFGYALDRYFNTKPWGMIILILLGAAAGIRNIFRLVALSENSAQSVSTKEEKEVDQ